MSRFKNLISADTNKLPRLWDKEITAFDVLDGIIYLLSLDDVDIKWLHLDRKLEIIVRANWIKNNPNYDILQDAFRVGGGSPDPASTWESYFCHRKVSLGLNLGVKLSRIEDHDLIFKSYDWLKFKKMIEEYLFPRLKQLKNKDKENIITKMRAIAEDLVSFLNKDAIILAKKAAGFLT